VSFYRFKQDAVRVLLQSGMKKPFLAVPLVNAGWQRQILQPRKEVEDMPALNRQKSIF